MNFYYQEIIASFKIILPAYGKEIGEDYFFIQSNNKNDLLKTALLCYTAFILFEQ